MKSKRMFCVVISVIMVLLLALSGCAGNQAANAPAPQEQKKVTFPEHQIEIVMTGTAGGGTDIFARAVAQELQDILKVPIVVTNITGAGGVIAMEEMTKRPADGYTIFASPGSFPMMAAQGSIADPSLIEGLALFHEEPCALHVNPAGKYKDVEALVAAAKANPGIITVGGVYTLTFDDILVRKFEEAAGIDLNYIPYEKATQFHADLMGGHIDVISDEYGALAEVIKAGKVKPILNMGATRCKSYPDVPCSVEKGWNVTMAANRSFLIKTGTPKEIKAIWDDALLKAYKSERYQKFATERGLLETEAYLGAEAFNKVLNEQTEEYKAFFATVKK